MAWWGYLAATVLAGITVAVMGIAFWQYIQGNYFIPPDSDEDGTS